MSTTATPPAKPAAVAPAPTPAPAPTAAPSKATPVAPAIPAAQKASVRQAPAVATTTNSRTPPEAPPTLDNEMRKLAEEHFKPKADDSAPIPETKTKPAPLAEASPSDKPAATPPLAEADPFAHIKEPEFKTEASREGWKALKKEAAEKVKLAEQKFAEAAAKLETYQKATPADTAEAARLKAELKDAHDKLAVFDLRSSPDFVRQYVEPKTNALKEAGEIIAYNGKAAGDLSKLLELPLKDFNAQVSDLTKDMNGMDAQTVQASLRQAHKLANEEKNALSKSGELKAALEAKHAAAERSAFEETRNEFTSKVPEIQIPDGADEEKIAEVRAYNEARLAAVKKAESYTFGKMDAKGIARVAQQAAALEVVAQHLIPSLQRDLKRASELNAQLAAELQAIKAGKNPGKFTESAAPAAASTGTKSFQQLADDMFAGKTR